MKTQKLVIAAAIALFSAGMTLSSCDSKVENAQEKVADEKEDVIEAQEEGAGNVAEEQAELDSARVDLAEAWMKERDDLREELREDQTEIDEPFPTISLRPLERSSLPKSILLQANEGLVPREAGRKEPLGKYLLFKNLLRSEEGEDKILHACLARRAWLKVSISLKPIPPRTFGMHNLSQLNQ